MSLLTLFDNKKRFTDRPTDFSDSLCVVELWPQRIYLKNEISVCDIAFIPLLCLPIWRGGDMLVYLCLLSSSAQFVSVHFLRLSCRWSNTRRWLNARLMLAHVYDSEPTLAQFWVTVSCLAPSWIWARVTDGGPTLTQLWFNASCPYCQHAGIYLTDIGSVSACNRHQQ